VLKIFWSHEKMKALIQIITICGLSLLSSVAFAQRAGDAVKLDYGTVKAIQTVQAQGTRGAGTMLGGLAGAAIADDHRGLGAIAGGLLGGGLQKHQTSKNTLQQYTVTLVSGGTLVIDTEQEDMIVGDCVVVEKGQYANIRRVSGINCQQKYQQNPEHHKTAASSCQKAKDELNNAGTDDAIEQAVIKVRTLCED
jgi:outer membrane lipoprotein SlyB